MSARLEACITEALKVIPEVAPIDRFVAVNPLEGLVDVGFAEALGIAERAFRVRMTPEDGPPGALACAWRSAVERSAPEEAARIDREVASLMAWYVARLRSEDCYRWWRGLNGLGDTDAPPVDPREAIRWALELLGVPEEVQYQEFVRQFARLVGWAGFAKWCERSRQQGGLELAVPRVGAIEYLALRLAIEARRVGTVAVDWSVCPATPVRLDSLRRLEALRLRALLECLPPRASAPSGPTVAEVVLCIDPRSEPLRRHLEVLGAYDTRGVAGFFGLAVRAHGDDGVVDHCPVIVPPSLEGREASAGLGARLRASLDATRKGPLASLVLVEAAGIGAVPLSLVRTLFPRAVARARARRVARVTLTELDRERVLDAVAAAIATLDLTVELVVLLGHGATTTNQAHAAGYQCGACGGQSGAANALLLAELLAEPWVREGMAERGIRLAPDLVVVGGWHDTSAGTVYLERPTRVPEELRVRLDRVRADLDEAARRYRIERARALGGSPPAARAGDWAEVRPEWGATGNAFLVIGERGLTRGVDLEGRAFLCSWSAAEDPTGADLATILAGPLRVAQGISAQYYVQSVAPAVFGAGDKVGLNPIPGVGVVLGEGGDLRLGMPWQSFTAHGQPRHEPLRLTVLVDGPTSLVERVLLGLCEPMALVAGGWVVLCARDDDGRWVRFGSSHEWEPVVVDLEVAEG